MNKVLIVEDEKPIADLLKYGLEKEGFRAYAAYTGNDGLKAIDSFNPSVILLDIMLPDIDGLSICRKVTESKNIPIIMLTAKNDITDKLIGLEYGADDYITKPFDLREVVLRVKSILRRLTKAKQNEGEHIYRVDDIELDLEKHEVKKGDKLVDLTPKEFLLLQTLLENRGIVMSRTDLLQQVWEFEYFGDTRTVDIHIQRLRKKLGNDKMIVTVFGIGYKIPGEV